jgi:hypothetical protein
MPQFVAYPARGEPNTKEYAVVEPRYDTDEEYNIYTLTCRQSCVAEKFDFRNNTGKTRSLNSETNSTTHTTRSIEVRGAHQLTQLP